MNDQQKIEFGKFIKKLSSDHFFVFDKLTYVEIANAVLAEVQKMTGPFNIQPPNYKIKIDPINTCGFCYNGFLPDILKKNYDVCPDCKKDGKEKIKLYDPDGKLFYSGDILRNKEDLTKEVIILQCQPGTIVWCSVENGADFGCDSYQVFFDAGWIVHERVTPYDTVDGDQCADKCKFIKGELIGRQWYCKTRCEHNKGYSNIQQWVICKLYNKEYEDANL